MNNRQTLIESAQYKNVNAASVSQGDITALILPEYGGETASLFCKKAAENTFVRQVEITIGEGERRY